MTVGDAFTREINYNNKKTLSCLRPGGGIVLPEYICWRCCSNSFNQEETEDGRKVCKYCKRKCRNDKGEADPKERDDMGSMLASSALHGLSHSVPVERPYEDNVIFSDEGYCTGQYIVYHDSEEAINMINAPMTSSSEDSLDEEYVLEQRICQRVMA